MDEARISEVHGHVGVSLQERSHWLGRLEKPEGDLKDPLLDVVEDGIRSTAQVAQQIACFGDDGFARDEGPVGNVDGLGARVMTGFAAVEQSDDRSGVEQDRLHDRPNPRR